MKHTFCPLGIALSVLLLTGCGWGTADDADEKQAAFAECTGFSPPEAVRNIKSSHYWVRDSYSRWVYFECDAATLELVRQRATRREYNSRGEWDGPGAKNRNPNAPEWWQQAPDPTDFEKLEIDRSKDKYSWDLTHLYVDRVHHIVYARHDMSD